MYFSPFMKYIFTLHLKKLISSTYTTLQSNGVTSAELIIRKSQELETAPLIKTSPPQAQKLSKKTSVLSIKPKVMASPNAKHRKTSNEKGRFLLPLLTLRKLVAPKCILWQTGLYPDEMPHNVAFYQGLPCLL